MYAVKKIFYDHVYIPEYNCIFYKIKKNLNVFIIIIIC